MTHFDDIDRALLASVAGAADPGDKPADNARGRVGPGTGWKWLGNYYTPEALAHDNAVRGARERGSNGLSAHFGALPLLPGAVGSYFRARFAPGPNDMQVP